jgi:hypothetical protein
MAIFKKFRKIRASKSGGLLEKRYIEIFFNKNERSFVLARSLEFPYDSNQYQSHLLQQELIDRAKEPYLQLKTNKTPTFDLLARTPVPRASGASIRTFPCKTK